jgi:hypothetical protein
MCRAKKLLKNVQHSSPFWPLESFQEGSVGLSHRWLFWIAALVALIDPGSMVYGSPCFSVISGCFVGVESL